MDKSEVEKLINLLCDLIVDEAKDGDMNRSICDHVSALKTLLEIKEDYCSD